ncbi:MAG: galactokinase [Chloroflexota bacterium]|nr:galactokinase [Chloroflexota bacterium]
MNDRYRHVEALTRTFEQRFGKPPTLAARAPGRVNLIGEHTDYNDGWVLPVAIPYEVNVVAAPRTDVRVCLVAHDLNEEATFALNDTKPSADLWQRYPQGIAVQMQAAGRQLVGLDAVYAGDVPRGASLSSSAAVEVAFAGAFALASGVSLSGSEIATISRLAENEFVGVPTGVMDQFISALGKEGHALLLDCRSLEYRHIPINLPGVSIVVMDTGVRRELANSEYRKRRADCEAAVERLQSRLPDIRALRDVTPEDLEANADLLDETQHKRASHVVAENARTQKAAEALEAGDAPRIGALMQQSHESLRDLYEVSAPELDAVVEIAMGTAGVIGARMTGGGFGGAAVALVHDAAVDGLQQALAAEYPQRSGKEATVFVCRAAEGAEAKWLSEGN